MASPMPQDSSRLQPHYSLPPPPPALDPREPAAPPITSSGGHIHTSRNRSTGTPRTPCTPTRSPALSPVSSRAASPNPGLDSGRHRERGSFGANFQSHTSHGPTMAGGSALSSRPSSRATSPIRAPVSSSRRSSGGAGVHAGPAVITNSIDAALAAGSKEHAPPKTFSPTSPLSEEGSSPFMNSGDGLAPGVISPDLTSPRSRPASGTFSPRERLAARMSSKAAHSHTDAGLLGTHPHSATQAHQAAAFATGTFPRPVSPALSATASMSDSMIFERDIESPLPPPIPSNILEHRPSRRTSRASGVNGVTGDLSASMSHSVAHSQTHSVSNLHHHYTHGDFLESKIPTVLDDAIEALTALSESEKHLQAGGSAGGTRSRLVDIEVESPVPVTWAGVGASPSVTRLPNATTRYRPVSPSRSAIASPKASNPTSPLLESAQPRPQLSSRASSVGPALPGAFPTGNEQSSDSWRRKIQEWIGPKGFEEASAPISSSKRSGDDPDNKEAQASEKDGQLPVEAGTQRPIPTNPHPTHLLPSERHRISFVSYNDILTSQPLRVDPLSDITSGASGEPDHLPGTVSPALSMLSGGKVLVPGVDGRISRSVSLSRRTGSPPVPTDSPDNAGQARGSVLSGLPTSIQDRLGINAHAASVLPEERSKGEWEREGLGKGLQARLEELIVDDHMD
ncbi:hypothetical protein QFC21_001804 [Naganishia friedmannii]|uniref:Uncharacterized protein n=1 Tax=Naganishia friedmannii TaxID=89922 RepID=A0ACC2W1W7_9TREE|nr:hypothetical protein QFC21_001804 [Naganishia friedmannii]